MKIWSENFFNLSWERETYFLQLTLNLSRLSSLLPRLKGYKSFGKIEDHFFKIMNFFYDFDNCSKDIEEPVSFDRIIGKNRKLKFSFSILKSMREINQIIGNFSLKNRLLIWIYFLRFQDRHIDTVQMRIVCKILAVLLRD